ncbi:MAG: hypothetical protein U5L11_05240 [Arhodomonas sp.]|nr:hypothetical protein [Arhodomonas sp.]
MFATSAGRDRWLRWEDTRLAADRVEAPTWSPGRMAVVPPRIARAHRSTTTAQRFPQTTAATTSSSWSISRPPAGGHRGDQRTCMGIATLTGHVDTTVLRVPSPSPSGCCSTWHAHRLAGLRRRAARRDSGEDRPRVAGIALVVAGRRSSSARTRWRAGGDQASRTSSAASAAICGSWPCLMLLLTAFLARRW